MKETVEISKETGEKIVRIELPPPILEKIINKIKMTQGYETEFLNLSIQRTAVEKRMNEVFGLRENSAKAVNENVLESVRKLKLDRNLRWFYNIEKKVLERREPPELGVTGLDPTLGKPTT